MASKRRLRRKACTGKRRFVTAAAARAAIAWVHQRKGYQGFMKPYLCQFCNTWHFGHPPKRRGDPYR